MGHEASLVPSLCIMRYLEGGSVMHIEHNPESKVGGGGIRGFEAGEWHDQIRHLGSDCTGYGTG